MLDFNEIKKEYPSDLHLFSRGLLREYLQYLILGIIFSHPLGKKLSFLGGTCLRIVYKLNRFSEVLDFDNKDLTAEEFNELSFYIRTRLEKLGYIVEIRMVSKEAFYCYIKFPDILYKYGFSPHTGEKILIQLDTFDQGVDYDTTLYILDKFDIFKQIIITPKEVILAQKFWAITQRKRLNGRDFYDIMFLMQNTKPDIAFLEQKFGTTDSREIKAQIQESVSDANWDELSRDIAPFLFRKEDSERIKLFPEFLQQVEF